MVQFSEMECTEVNGTIFLIQDAKKKIIQHQMGQISKVAGSQSQISSDRWLQSE